MDRFAKIRFAIAAQIPGTRAHIAKQKRKFERDLRDKGFTRTEVKRQTAAHFHKDG
jgi:hypothetical protein